MSSIGFRPVSCDLLLRSFEIKLASANKPTQAILKPVFGARAPRRCVVWLRPEIPNRVRSAKGKWDQVIKLIMAALVPLYAIIAESLIAKILRDRPDGS